MARKTIAGRKKERVSSNHRFAAHPHSKQPYLSMAQIIKASSSELVIGFLAVMKWEVP
jgi:hypothetical protein